MLLERSHLRLEVGYSLIARFRAWILRGSTQIVGFRTWLVKFSTGIFSTEFVMFGSYILVVVVVLVALPIFTLVVACGN